MMKTKRMYLLLVAIAILIIAVTGIIYLSGSKIAHAAAIDNTDDYNFSIVSNENGEQSYSVSIKAAAKPSAETVIIPNTYNGLFVTEIANNGFTSCVNLKKVVLPTTIKKIGNNAFMNCAKLERISLPSIETIGMNAFAMCPTLDRIYIPNSVKTVGANILRNNANTVFIQSQADEVNAGWQSTWNSYFTGDIIYGIEPEDTVGYREIFDELNNVIGYEISEYQFITSEEADIVIYNSFRPNEESPYLPVLNICSEAFTFSQANSITVKDRRTVDFDAPEQTHKINIRSNAFLAFFGNEVSFEFGVSFNHPKGLQNTYDSMYDNSEITGDSNNKSTKIFEESTIKSITFPADVEFIPERAFYNCVYLENIKLYGEIYEGRNNLGNVRKIGSGAFSSCVSLSNIAIPSSVEEVGDFVFYDWSRSEKQTIYIDYYEGYLPESWSKDWFAGYAEKTAFEYKALTEIIIDMQDGNGTKLTVGVKPGLEMPELDKPIRKGYIFKGIYSEKDGGLPYYTNNMEINNLWEENESTTIYANWQIETYQIIYPDDIQGIPNSNPTQYTVEDSIVIEKIIHQGYQYVFSPNVIPKGTTGDIVLTFDVTPMIYSIKYVLDDYKGCAEPNDKKFTVEDEIVFENLEVEGYSFSWTPSKIEKGTIGDIEVIGTWTPNTYNIIYVTYGNTIHENPAEYTYGQELILYPATRGGYFVEWDKSKISAGTIGDVTITAIYNEKTLEQCYKNGVYELYTKNQFEAIRNHPNGCSGRTYRLMDDIWSGSYSNMYWVPLPEFNGTLDGNEYSLTGYAIDVSGGGNLGFCKINNGNIKNLKLGVRFWVEDTFSDVNVGAFAGINRGVISNCRISPVYNSPFFRCYAKGDSFMGCFAGSNEGTIENCFNSADLYGTCNMGMVAGKNSGTIKNCNVGAVYTDIEFEYRDYNLCVGGIVGLQTAGSVLNCSFAGRIIWTLNYRSETYPVRSENREMQPCAGIIIGYKQGGVTSGNSWKNDIVTDDKDNVVSKLEPCVVTWTTGSLWWQETHTHDQGLYFKNEECGRIA